MSKRPNDSWPPETMLGLAVVLAIFFWFERTEGRLVESGLFIVAAVIAFAAYLVLRRLKGISGQLEVLIKTKIPDLFE